MNRLPAIVALITVSSLSVPSYARRVNESSVAQAVTAQPNNTAPASVAAPAPQVPVSRPATDRGASISPHATAPGPVVAGEPVSMVAGTSAVLQFPARVQTVVVAQSTVADAKPVSPQEVIVVGRTVGVTDVVFQLETGDTITRRVRVTLDKVDLESRLRQIFGVQLQADDIGGTVSLQGSLPNVATGAQVKNYMDATGMKWVDMTRIAGVQQVQLRVRIAEASRVALRELAFGAVMGGTQAFGGINSPGAGSPFQPVSIAPAPLSGAGAGRYVYPTNSEVTPASTLFGGITGSNLEVYLRALSENRYVRLLAEPNLVAVSGEKATFLVGGEFPIPVPQSAGVGNGTAITIEYKEFGVRLNFRPEVLGEGRIRLDVAPEVSELSEIGALDQNGFKVPSVIVRRSSTTVELGSGQAFAMAGLLRTKEEGKVAKVPLLGDIPGLGVLFRSVRYSQDQTELVVIVTAELVEPIDDSDNRPLPGDLHEAPNDWELFMNGALHGANEIASPIARLKKLGLEGIRGPGAWRRPDEARVAAADAFPPSQPIAQAASPETKVEQP